MMTVRLLALLLAALLAAPSASAEGWVADESRPATCRDGRLGCQILQFVMNGDFSALDPSNSLEVRALSSALPRLLALTDDDMQHFTDEFGVEQRTLLLHFYAALGHCLWADIIAFPQGENDRETQARRVLLLFLSPAEKSTDIEERAAIRSGMTDAVMRDIAELTGLPIGFLDHLFFSDDWRDVSPRP